MGAFFSGFTHGIADQKGVYCCTDEIRPGLLALLYQCIAQREDTRKLTRRFNFANGIYTDGNEFRIITLANFPHRRGQIRRSDKDTVYTVNPQNSIEIIQRSQRFYLHN